jgi:hypothetical protein
MNAKGWAEKLNGIEYPANEIYRANKDIKADGLIIAYGMSDDLLEFVGCIGDEVGAWEGQTVKLTPKPSIFNADENKETFEYKSMEIAQFPRITAIWGPRDKGNKVWASWDISTDLPVYEVFNIMEDGELFGRGIIFEAKAIEDFCK